MADPNPNQKDEAKQQEGLSMEKRLLLAFVLMGAVLFLTPYIYKQESPPAKAPSAAKTQQAKEAVNKSPATPAPAPAAATPVSAATEETFIVDTELYRVVFSNRGAVVRSWVLKQYKDSKGSALELVNAAAAGKVGYPFSLTFGNQKPGTDVNQALFAVKPNADGLGVEYEFSDGHVLAKKSFRFRRDSYLSQVSSSFALDGKLLPHELVWRGGFGDRLVPNHPNSLHSLYFDPGANKLVVEQAKVAKNGPVSSSGAYSFAGIEDTYFTAVAMTSGRPFEIKTFSDTVPSGAGAAEVAHLGVGIGGPGENQFSLFVGPKDIDILRSVNPRLEQVVDFGWFAIIAKPLFLSLNWVTNHWVHDYGWSIIVVTVIINFLLLPLKFTSLKSMKRMQLLQPQIAAINEKYKGIGLRDPRKADQNQEIMELYKKHGVNPMGGCFPMLLQIPFFYAFYKVLSVAIEMRGASWLWVTDLSQPENLPIRVLPVAMTISQFVMQKMTPTTTADPSQQRVMMLMPLMMGFIFYGVSSGLVLYWLTGNLVGIAQQWYFNRGAVPPPAPAAALKARAKRNPRK